LLLSATQHLTVIMQFATSRLQAHLLPPINQLKSNILLLLLAAQRHPIVKHKPTTQSIH
jgi:hypothetical protein